MPRKILKVSLCVLALAAVVAGIAMHVIHKQRYTEFCGTEIEVSTAALDLRDMTYTVDELIALSQRMEAVTDIQLGLVDLTYEDVEQIRLAYPKANVSYSINLFGEEYPHDTTALDLSEMDAEVVSEYISQLLLLPELQQINLMTEAGKCNWGVGDIAVMDAIRSELPQVRFDVQFDLFGQTVSSEDTRIEYYLADIGNEGAETIRRVLPYLESCEYFLLDGCGIDYEILAEMREAFPATKIVWRVWLGEPDYKSPRSMRARSFLTDTHRIRTTAVNDSNCHLLKYCVETKYVDFGHNHGISDFFFLSYMPQLEVAILALTKCNDLTPLANCIELEYLEVYRSDVTDLSPIANCKKLKHLNFGDTDISDITCLYDIDLERIRGCVTDVPKEQFDKYAELHPDCQILNEGGSPSKNGWRKDANGVKVPRYALLQQQMEYAIDAQYGIK